VSFSFADMDPDIGPISYKMCTTLRVLLPYLIIGEPYSSDLGLSDHNLYQVEVEIGDLKEFGRELGKMLQERLKSNVEMNGNMLMLSESPNGHLRPKDVKMQVKHILHHLGFSHEYRVLSEHTLIRIVRVEKKRRHMEKSGAIPNPSQSLPYLFP